MSASKVYQRLLHAAKRIDAGGPIVHSAILGLPQHLYSYHHRKNMDIGKETYQGLNKFLKTSLVGSEFADPSMRCDPISDYVQRYHAIHLDKPDKEYSEDLLYELELLASIADKINLQTDANDDGMDDADYDEDEDQDQEDNDVYPETTNPMIISPNTKYNNQSNLSNQSNQSTTPPQPMLTHIPGLEVDAIQWKGALHLQHPMSVSDAYGRDAVPSVMLGIDVVSKWDPDKSQKEMEEQRVYHGIMLNQPSILDVSYIMKSTMTTNKKMKYSLKTTHGFLTVPRMFHDRPVYIGGDTVDQAAVLTTSKFCKGIPVMNGNLFLNPDLTVAKRMIEAGHASIDEFRFFSGKMAWNADLFRNVHRHRNMYATFEVNKSTSTQDIKNLINAVWNETGQREPWIETLKYAPSEWSAWIKLFEMMKSPHLPGVQCACTELKALKELHRNTVATQISYWQQLTVSQNDE